ncbi:glucosaminidase domain-containing protein [Ferruginibacter sp. SUN106]|uniref:glucosaminidase domain-containing protein n=1 Tax=Ferruginibacter sp. SUN106 TaxID=2978348 RepID=UPI003D35EBF0
MKRLFIVGVLFLSTAVARAQSMLTPEQYIAMYKDIAIKEMKRMGVPAAITLAQGILETESGNSDLVKKSNNHFGIKCKANWTGASVTHDDDAAGECFRLYKTADDSYRDHSNFLRGSERYGFLFKLDVKDYKGWAYGLKKAGYATNPAYPQILIKHIEQYNLQQYTLVAADEVPKFDAGKYQDDAEDKGTTEKIADDAKVPDEASMLDVSDKVISVNGSKCVYAGKGTSLLVVATKNNIPLSKMLSFNELSEDGMLIKNQNVFLEKKSKTGETDFYIAKAGESLYDIAQKNGIQLQYMLDYNKFWGNEDILAGTKIYLKPNLAPARQAAAPSVNSVVTAAGSKTHIVAAKEGLYGIAKKYNITVQQLKEWNNLDGDALHIGQELIIAK